MNDKYRVSDVGSVKTSGIVSVDNINRLYGVLSYEHSIVSVDELRIDIDDERTLVIGTEDEYNGLLIDRAKETPENVWRDPTGVKRVSKKRLDGLYKSIGSGPTSVDTLWVIREGGDILVIDSANGSLHISKTDVDTVVEEDGDQE